MDSLKFCMEIFPSSPTTPNSSLSFKLTFAVAGLNDSPTKRSIIPTASNGLIFDVFMPPLVLMFFIINICFNYL